MNIRSDARRETSIDSDEVARLYRLLIDHSSDVVAQTTPQGVIDWVSPAVERMLGWDPVALCGQTPLDITHPDDHAMALRAHGDLNAGREVHLETRLRAADGTYRWVAARIRPLVVEGGVVTGRVANWRDVTVEHEARVAHDTQEQWFRTVIDQAADPVLHTTDGVITWVSSAIVRFTGWQRSELVGTHSSQWVLPDDHAVMATLRHMRTADRPGRARCRIVCHDGSHRWFEVTSVPVDDDAGKRSAVSILRDIDDQVRAEVQRDGLARRLEATIAAMLEPHAYLEPVWDSERCLADLSLVSLNAAACSYLQRSQDELVGQRISTLLPRHVDRGLVERAREVVQSGAPYVIDDVGSWNDLLGAYRRYDIRLTPVDDMLALTFRDVTERHERFVTEARVRAMEALGEERERLARDLHDGAIQKVFATSMRLAALASMLPDHQRRRVEELIDLQDAAIRDLRTTVYDLGTTGRRSASPRAAVHDTVREAARALGFEPALAIHDDVTELGEETLGHLVLVLREALSNVARHARARLVEVDLTLSGSEVVLSVWDDGVGMAADRSHGNGLTNMSRRAHMLGGMCDVASEPGGGTTVLWRAAAMARSAHQG